jgi:riboflavin synthase
MFTGIIEEIAEVTNIEKEGGNIHFTLKAKMTSDLKIDQSIAHNGCCLTVVEISNETYKVTAIQETLDKTNLNQWEIGTKVNLERCMQMNGRLDGHIVQGHVDTIGTCEKIEEQNGSWKFTFSHKSPQLTVEKGSITVNGTSLTVVDSERSAFSVCIIPYTFENTNFSSIREGDQVNLEFDINGKYVAKWVEAMK